MELEISKGEWIYEGGDNNSIDIVLPDDSTISIDRQSRYSGEYVLSREGMQANAILIADAGTTANKCQLLPSELLVQRDELLKQLKACNTALMMEGYSENDRKEIIETINKTI